MEQRLTFVQDVEIRYISYYKGRPQKSKQAIYKCGYCSNEKILKKTLVKGGFVKSCGCTSPNIIHGKKKTSEWSIWSGMKTRCCNKNDKAYNKYGGRGIKIDERWLEKQGKGFINFLKDMGEKPGEEYSLDRINNDGNYCKENCRWATKREQGNNKRNNKFITYNNETKTIKQWADYYQVNYYKFYYYIKTGGNIAEMQKGASRMVSESFRSLTADKPVDK